MPANQRNAPDLLSTGGGDATHGVIPFAVPVSSTTRLHRHYAPLLTQFLVNTEAPFNLLDYLHLHGQAIVVFLTAGFSHRQLYRLFTQDPKASIDLSYRFFSKNVALFRQQKGLPPSRRSPTAKSLALTRGAATPSTPAETTANAAPLQPPASVDFSVDCSPSSVQPDPASTVALSPGPLTPAIPVISAPTVHPPGKSAARLAVLFAPFTLEDAKTGKPIAQAIADHQRAELAAFEQSLLDGTAPD